MKTNIISLLITILIIIIITCYYFCNEKNYTNNYEKFIDIPKSQLYVNTDTTDTIDTTPVEINSPIPVPVNHLTGTQLSSLDNNILRNKRVLKQFSLTDELDIYQIYNILKILRNKAITFKYNINTNKTPPKIQYNETLLNVNSGAINNIDLDLFTRIKLEIISSFNTIIINKGYHTNYHPYHFYKIINSNLISYETKDVSRTNAIFTLTFSREFKYQQFVIYYDCNIIKEADNTYNLKFNKIELTGVTNPNTIEFHKNNKIVKQEMTTIEQELTNEMEKEAYTKDYYYKDQVSDNIETDVVPNEENSKLFQKQNTKFIDIYERTDIDPTLLDINSVTTKINDKIMSISKDKQFKNHKCFSLVNGVSKELPYYKNPIFCKSYHPEINQTGIWDAPCQIDNDCPFYKANKNYPNTNGKCNKNTGICEMPVGVIPIGFTKYGKLEPDCYNCNITSPNNKCCGKQQEEINKGNVHYNSPDYIFINDENKRKQFKEGIKSLGLKVNPSI